MKRYANKVFTPIVLLMLFIFAAIIFLSFRQTAEAKTSAAMVAHSQEVLIQTSKILTLITDNETGSRGFLITGNRVFLEPLERSKANVYPQIDSLRLLTKDNPSQQARIDSLIYYTKKVFVFSDSTILLRNEKGLEPALQAAAAGKGKLYMDIIRKLTDNMLQEEYRLLEERKITHEKATTILNRTFISIIVVIVVLLFILLRKDYLAIAARKTAEDALKKNETFFQLMTNNVKDYAIFMLDITGVEISIKIA